MVIQQLSTGLKRIIPQALKRKILALKEKIRLLFIDRQFMSKSPEFIFSTVYRDKLWGTWEDGKFMSGHGSHHPVYVDPYVTGMIDFLEALSDKPVIADLGCGDFNVGSRLVTHARRYIACDVVPDLLQDLGERFNQPNLEFRAVDIVNEDLPEADIYIVRQVLQHLSNGQITAFLRNVMESGCSYLVVCEYLPKGDFVPNIDQPCGSHSRLARGINSGIIITEPPFEFRYESEEVLAESDDGTARLITTMYRL